MTQSRERRHQEPKGIKQSPIYIYCRVVCELCAGLLHVIESHTYAHRQWKN